MKRKSTALLVLAIWLVVSLACVVPAGGGTTTPPPTDPPTATLPPLPPAPLGQIAYGSDRGGTWQVIVMDADGGNEASLTGGFPGEYSRPAWSPDGSRLGVRMEISMDGGGIAVMNVSQAGGVWSASAPVPLVHGFTDGPRWSPDSGRLVYVDATGDQGWLAFTVAASGEAPAAVPGIPEGATDVDWSPDGSRFVYSFYPDPGQQIHELYRINADGSGLVQLTNTPTLSEQGPSWSPDGTRIAFSAASYGEGEGYGGEDIFIINADGSGLVQVTSDPGDEFDPAWSPDGTQLAFVSDRYDFNDGNYEIFVINTDGSGELRLTNNHATDRWPSWRAAPAGTGMPSPACAAAGELVADVTIPLGTRFAAPQDFTKTWRVRNSGTCAWTPTAYSLRFIEGEQMGGPGQVLLPGAIQPGADVDLSVPLTAPATPGLHMGKWGLFDGNGQPVPGPDGAPLILTVIVEVLAPGTAVLPAPLYYLSEETGTAQVWRLEPDAATRAQVTFEPAAVDAFAISPADGALAYTSGGQLFLADEHGAGRQAIAGPGGESAPRDPAWSPDGTRLAYGLGGVHVYEIATGEDRLLIASETGGMPGSTAFYTPLAWSPDGTKILTFVGLYEGAGLYILSAEEGTIEMRAPYEAMYAWRNDSTTFFLASATFPMMSGIEPGLWLAGDDYSAAPLVSGVFAWWPLQRPDGQLQFFVSPPVDFETRATTATLVRSNADESGQSSLREQPFLIDTTDGFTATWFPDGSSFAAAFDHPATGAREALWFPANDTPPVFLMQAGSNFIWGR